MIRKISMDGDACLRDLSITSKTLIFFFCFFRVNTIFMIFWRKSLVIKKKKYQEISSKIKFLKKIQSLTRELMKI